MDQVCTSVYGTDDVLHSGFYPSVTNHSSLSRTEGTGDFHCQNRDSSGNSQTVGHPISFSTCLICCSPVLTSENFSVPAIAVQLQNSLSLIMLFLLLETHTSTFSQLLSTFSFKTMFWSASVNLDLPWTKCPFFVLPHHLIQIFVIALNFTLFKSLVSLAVSSRICYTSW